jgi:hypothetical protein
MTILDKWENTEFDVSQCVNCKHKNIGQPTCEAFKDGIPIEILKNTIKHNKPTPYQKNDIVYEKLEN